MVSMNLATTTFVSTNDGGRSTPITSGYRPQFFFEREDFECRSIQILPDRRVLLGETANVEIRLSEYATAALHGRVIPGKTFELHEGRKSVAGGVVTGLGNSNGPSKKTISN
jgi:elongation factor Tu